jgi:hypothetical protein
MQNPRLFRKLKQFLVVSRRFMAAHHLLTHQIYPNICLTVEIGLKKPGLPNIRKIKVFGLTVCRSP